jgi:uncharacterized protein
MENKIVIDAHCHIMNNKCIPKKHRSRQSKIKPEILEWILEKFDLDDTNYNWIDKFQTIIRIGNINSIEEVAKFLIEKSGNTKREAPERNLKTIYVPLMMDMTHEPRKWSLKELGREKIMTFEKQVEQNKNAILNNPGRILPFLAADPRTIERKGFENFMKIYRDNGFIGMKVYPPLGYEPSHPVLIKLYKECIKENIPVTTHCCYGGSYSTSKKDLNGNKLKTDDDRLEYWGNMPNPDKWFDMMDDYDLQDLKLNFGHFGGDGIGRNLRPEIFEKVEKKQKQAQIEIKWRKSILKGLKDSKYPNLYTDVSFHPRMEYESKAYFNQLKGYLANKKLRKHIMFGTDWWMSSFVLKQSAYLINFIKGAQTAQFSQSEIDHLLLENAKSFLGLDKPNEKGGPFKNYLDFLERNNKLDELPLWFREAFNC